MRICRPFGLQILFPFSELFFHSPLYAEMIYRREESSPINEFPINTKGKDAGHLCPASLNQCTVTENYLYRFCTAKYTGSPSSVMPTLHRDMINPRVPERNSWLMMTNTPLRIASAGITG